MMTEDLARTVRKRLLEWFVTAARDLPWRRSRDPYRVWLSEIMLQQTRVDQAAPYYERFLKQYPDVGALASASLDDVLLVWEGLGYYARARNMHRAAQMLVRENAGCFPEDRAGMLRLPGVGPYTANAVLSIAGGLPLAVVDANVARVICRLFEVEGSPQLSAVSKRLQALADELLSRESPGTFNEAMMELGATVCTKRDPQCPTCPLRNCCSASGNGTVDRYPTTIGRKPRPTTDIAVALIRDDNDRIFIQRRAEDGLLGGLWEFPGGKIEAGETPWQACEREVWEELGIRIIADRSLPIVRHEYSHFKVVAHPFVCSASMTSEVRTKLNNVWVSPDNFHRYAMPGATRKIIDDL